MLMKVVVIKFIVSCPSYKGIISRSKENKTGNQNIPTVFIMYYVFLL